VPKCLTSLATFRRSSIEINRAAGVMTSGGKQVGLSDFLCAPLAGDPATAA
jgi:hypothetical protein